MLLGLAGEAFAQTSTEAPDRAWPSLSPAAYQPATRQWYGDELLIGYGASDLLVATGVIGIIGLGGFHGSGDPTPFVLIAGTGLVVQVFAAPIIHWAHGHVDRGFLSLVLNGGLPFAAGTLGFLADEFGGGVILGVVTGMLIGRAIDVAVLSYEEDEEGSPAPGRRGAWAPALTLAPIIGRDQTGLGVAGVF